MSIRNELGIERRVVASEVVELPRATVQGLMEAIRASFKGVNKPTRILYTKGEGLLIERMVPESEVGGDNTFLTPWEMCRQHADLEIMEVGQPPLQTMCQAASSLAEKGYTASMIVANNREEVDEWFGKDNGKIDAILRLPFLEDPDCPEHCVVFCGSKTGDMVQHIEHAVLCRLRDG